jgi:hypothetical protein
MALHITALLGIANFSAPADGSTCLRGETAIVYRTLSGECRLC